MASPASPEVIVSQSPASPEVIISQRSASPEVIINRRPASPEVIVSQNSSAKSVHYFFEGVHFYAEFFIRNSSKLCL